MERYVLQYKDAKDIKREIGHDSVPITSYHFSSRVLFNYEVKIEGWYNMAIELCLDEGKNGGVTGGSVRHTSNVKSMSADDNDDDMMSIASSARDDWMSMDGTIRFKNPYGYLPSSLFGLLPYQIILVIGYLVIIAYYVYSMIRYKDALIGLNYGVLLVLIIACVESTMWLVTYVYVNKQGTPFCCPYPVLVEVSYIGQIIRQTVSRALLLIISMGYGMAKESLSRWEWLGIVLITVTYYMSATFSEVFDMTIKNHISVNNYNKRDSSAVSNGDTVIDEQFIYFADIAIDSIFIVWIYNSFVTTINILKEYSQTYKLALYNKLFTSIIVFIILFMVATLLLFYCNYMAFNFPWQLEWIPVVLFPTLNYSILLCTALICIPNETSRYLTYATQLPNYDIDSSNTNSTSIEMIHPHMDMVLEDYEDAAEDDIMNQKHGTVIQHHMTPPISKLMYKPSGSTKTPTPVKYNNHHLSATPPGVNKYNIKINPSTD